MSYNRSGLIYTRTDQSVAKTVSSLAANFGPPHKGKSKLPALGAIRFETYRAQCKTIYKHCSKYGLLAPLPKDIPRVLLNHVEQFLYNLTFWEMIPIGKCLSVVDILYGSLIVGPSYAEWLKKARAFTMQYNITISDSAIPEEYILEGWEGYDSIFPETSLIHWEEEVFDFPFSLKPLKRAVPRFWLEHFENEIIKFGPKELKLYGTTDALRFIKASKCFDPITKKSIFVRDIFPSFKNIEKGFLGKRQVIQALPGGARDAAMASPSTLIKIKLSTEIFLSICQHHPNSGMCDNITQRKRISRLRRGNLFLHFDFKKMGLYAPRGYFILLMEAVQNQYGIDMSWFDFEDVFILVDEKEVVRTQRGYCLGWMNEGITLVIITLLRQILSKLHPKIDFLVFNDDVEISIPKELQDRGSLDVLKTLLIQFFEEHDFLCSIKKIFFSRESIFLEDYYAPDSKFDFRKRSIATRIYAKAAVSSYPFMRKSYLAVASELWNEPSIIDMIISKMPLEFPPSYDELNKPFLLGGFFHSIENGFDVTFYDAPNLAMLRSRFVNAQVDLETLKYSGWNQEKGEKAQSYLISTARLNPPPGFRVPDEDIAEALGTDTMEYLLSRLYSLPEGHPLKEINPDVKFLVGLGPAGIG